MWRVALKTSAIQAVVLFVSWTLYQNYWQPYALSRVIASHQQGFEQLVPKLTEQAKQGNRPTLDSMLAELQQDYQLDISELNQSEWDAYFVDTPMPATGQVVSDSLSGQSLVALPGPTYLSAQFYYVEEPGSPVLFLLVTWLALTAAVAASLAASEQRIRSVSRQLDEFVNYGREVSIARPSGAQSLDELQRSCAAVLDKAQELGAATRQSIADQRDLLHAVAHEFRSPIARLSFAHDMLLESDEPAQESELLPKIDRAIIELDDLVTEVLGYSRIKHGGYQLNYTEVDLQEIANTVARRTRELYPRVQIELATPFARGAEHILADPLLLTRALQNLVRNAARFARRNVQIQGLLQANTFTLAVDDDGIGIPPGKRERIFEPFTRLDASRSRDSGGVGLGLAIVKAISKQHGGTVHVAESLLGGARFELTWPRSTGRC